MRPLLAPLALAAALTAATSSLSAGSVGAAPPTAAGHESVATVRFATFNASLNRGAEGDLVRDLSTPGNAQAAAVAEIIQRTDPDVLLINEFDYVEGGVAADLFRDNYLAVGQHGADPVDYPYSFVAPVNTGVPSGLDLDNNGTVGGPNDAFGFGFFPGQYGMVVYSKYPIDRRHARTFQQFLWKDLPGARLPDDPSTPEPADWYSAEELDQVRLSSKSHWDLPIRLPGRTVHFLVSHPTPPVFDGPEDRNGTRNADEIRFWSDYVSGARYPYDDRGRRGGLPRGAAFVLAGDQNSDPLDGDSIPGAAQQLLDSPRVNSTTAPTSAGAVEASADQGGANLTHRSPAAQDTADFSEPPGNLRADYVLPSRTLRIQRSGVFWPPKADPLSALTGVFPFPSSDHRLVWADLVVSRQDRVPNPAGARLVGRSVLPTETYVPGSEPSGHWTSGNAQIPAPYPAQPVQGFSGTHRLRDGSYLVTTDNGFGARANSADALLAVHRIRPDLRTGETAYAGTRFTLSDPRHLVPWTLWRDGGCAAAASLPAGYACPAPDRQLTGADLDPESMQLAPDGTFWFGDEFGPFLVHADRAGRLLEPPVPTPGVTSPSNPMLEPGQVPNLANSKGLEGLAISPDGRTLHPLLEGPVAEDVAAGLGGDLRLFTVRLERGGAAFEPGFLRYRLESPAHAIGDFILVNDHQGLVVERDNGQGSTAAFKRVYLVGLDDRDGDGYVSKDLVIDLMRLPDPDGVGGAAGFFTFPYLTIEDLEILGPRHVVVMNDNNFPATGGRGADVPDVNELLRIRLGGQLRVDGRLTRG